MLDLIFKTIVIFLILLVLMRLLGKRQLGELELSELVVSILAADLAATPLQNPELPLWNGLIPVVALFFCELLLSWLTAHSIPLRLLLCGKPCFLVVEGKICQKAMGKCRFTVDELTEELRCQSVTDIAQVQYAVLETDGRLNVILFPEYRPATGAQLRLAPEEDDGYALILIEEGRLIRENLRVAGKDEAWLQAELRHRGCEKVSQVYLLLLFKSGKIYFAEKE